MQAWHHTEALSCRPPAPTRAFPAPQRPRGQGHVPGRGRGCQGDPAGPVRGRAGGLCVGKPGLHVACRWWGVRKRLAGCRGQAARRVQAVPCHAGCRLQLAPAQPPCPPPRSAWPLDALPQEACRLQGLKHPHVITFYGVSWDEPTSTGLIVTEYCVGERALQQLGPQLGSSWPLVHAAGLARGCAALPRLAARPRLQPASPARCPCRHACTPTPARRPGPAERAGAAVGPHRAPRVWLVAQRAAHRRRGRARAQLPAPARHRAHGQ